MTGRTNRQKKEGARDKMEVTLPQSNRVTLNITDNYLEKKKHLFQEILLSHKTNHNKFQRIDILQAIISDLSEKKFGISN